MSAWFVKALTPLKRAALSFVRYPASMGFALALTGLTFWLVHETPTESMKLFSTLQLTFSFGAVLGMALTVLAGEYNLYKRFFRAANLLAVLVSAGVFFAVYLPKDLPLSDIALMRIAASIAVFFLAFLIIPAAGRKPVDFNRMVFMVLKSFFIAAVYAIILMLGFFFVAFAVESLIYENLSEKIYLYIALICGLVGYAFFLGYFPPFRQREEDEEEEAYAALFETATKQPKFAQVLFQNIMIPILAALTLVLLIWSVRILFTGNWPDYHQVTAIFTAYSLSAIFLYFLVSASESLIVRIYRRVIPIALLVFLVFEAYPVANRIFLYGIQPSEYALVMIILFSVVTGILFLWLPIRKHYVSACVAIGLIVLFILPGIGANDFSYKSQERHLRRVLDAHEMLDGDRIVPSAEIPTQDQIRITKAIDYLYNEPEKEVPLWLSAELESPYYGFREVFGFDRINEFMVGEDPGIEPIRVYFSREAAVLELEGYTHYIPRDAMTDGRPVLETARGEYVFSYPEKSGKGQDAANNDPSIALRLDGEIILHVGFDGLTESLRTKYADSFIRGRGVGSYVTASVEDLLIRAGNEQIQVLVVFRSVDLGPSGSLDAGFDLEGIYFLER